MEVSHTLFDLERIYDHNGGKAPLTYQRFQTVFASLGAPPKPKPAPESIPGTDTEREKEFHVPKTLQVKGEHLTLPLRNGIGLDVFTAFGRNGHTIAQLVE